MSEADALKRGALIEHWKVVIGAQMHFNDMLLRTRTLGVSVVIGVFGAAAAIAARSPQPTVALLGLYFHSAALVVLLGLALLLSVFLLDYCYYYKLLLCAVERGEQLEGALQSIAPEDSGCEFSLSQFLSDRVSRRHARWVIWGFYGVPLVVGVCFFFLV